MNALCYTKRPLAVSLHNMPFNNGKFVGKIDTSHFRALTLA